MKTLSAEHKAKLHANRTGRESLRCVFCRTTCDRRPFETHVRSCFEKAGNRFPNAPPIPDLFYSLDGRNRSDEAKFRAKLGPKQLRAYYVALFEDERFSWSEMVEEAQNVLYPE